MTEDATPAAVPGDKVDILHLYAQDRWHSPAVISGSRSGLELLRRAIDDALANGTSAVEVMTDDGEGYAVVVMHEGPDDMEGWTAENLDRGLPYVEDIAACPADAGFWQRVHRIAASI